jgi:hypothetical protein
MKRGRNTETIRGLLFYFSSFIARLLRSLRSFAADSASIYLGAHGLSYLILPARRNAFRPDAVLAAWLAVFAGRIFWPGQILKNAVISPVFALGSSQVAPRSLDKEESRMI